MSIIGLEAELSSESPDMVASIRQGIEAYFAGERVDFANERLDLGGASPFLTAAWAACLTIPYGETRTYKWLAEQAGRPRAPRAAGQSMARNRLPIVVPCHRVVASDGSLRGFGRGASQLDLKQTLLDLERAS
jgi:methylated-DNA-[protein]-cysteine S-methyltransferase